VNQEYTRSSGRVLRNFSRSSQESSEAGNLRKTNASYEFGPFRLDVGERWLLRNGDPVPLPPKAFDTLLLLVQESGHLVQKEELMNRVWPDAVVEEGNLTQTIFLLRRTLGENARESKYIETAPRFGYRFVAPVTVVPESEPVPLGLVESPQREPRWTTKRKASVIGIVFAIVAAGVAAWAVARSNARQTAATVRSLAVLPFKPLVADQRDESLEVGIADALITRLSSLRQIAVRPTNAVLKYSDPGRDLAAAGRELRVDAVLDGKIQRVANRIRVTVQLVRARDSAPLWAQAFDSEFSGIFAVQDAISEQLARALVLTLTPVEQKQVRKRDTESAEAYELYLQGVYFWRRRTEQGAKKSIQYLEQALQCDPNYALAHAKLASSYGVLGYYGGLPPAEAYPKVKAESLRALQIDDTLAEAHTHLGTYYINYEWDWQAGERELLRAIEIDPRYALAHRRYAFHLEAVGRFEESRAQAELARQLDPEGLPSSDAEAEAAAETNPDFALAHFTLGMGHLRRAEFSPAIASLEKAAIVSGRAPFMLAALGCGYGMAGRKADAREVLHELNKLAEKRYVSPFDVAMVYSGLGEKEHAFEWLERSYRERAPRLTRLKAGPWFAPIASEPRFAELVRRVGISR
jgi:DNA-binding winged helix-turn-helix (wHTH) protein/TolB-like protein